MIVMRKWLKELLIRLFAYVCRDESPKVVFYHDIGKQYTPMGTDTRLFWSHMKHLRENDIVNFDDGFRGIWDAREEFKAINFRLNVIVNVAVGLIGKNGYLTWEEIRKLQDDYGFVFQSHTWSHQTLIGPYNYEVAEPKDGRTEEWYQHELVDSKVELEQRLGKKVTILCFPVGYFSDDVLRRCKDAGYKKVYVSYPGNITDKYVQPRCLVQDLSLGGFRAALNGGMLFLRKRFYNMHFSH